MGKFVDISGMKFGRLTVIDRAPNRDKTTMWNCECECSNKTVVPGGDLKNGTTKSCGCLQIDVVKKRNYKHGFSKRLRGDEERFYGVHAEMIQRCYSETSNAYHYYGGRGIKVCDRWMGENGFINFKEDMWNKYKSGLSIDRIDNNGNYLPENCRWATRKEQANNTRQNRIITYKGESLNLTQWASKLGVSRRLLSHRLIGLKWSDERTLSTKKLIQNRTVEYNGVKMTFSDFCEKFNLDYDRTYKRLFSYGWSFEKIMNKQ